MCRIETQAMTRKCQHWLDDNNYQVSLPKIRSGLGKLLNRLGITSIGKSGRGSFYELLQSDVFRDKFCNLLGHSQKEIFD